MKNWMKLDERPITKLKASNEITEMFSDDNEPMDTIDSVTNKSNSNNSVTRSGLEMTSIKEKILEEVIVKKMNGTGDRVSRIEEQAHRCLNSGSC